jgi:hypothetical protein
VATKPTNTIDWTPSGGAVVEPTSGLKAAGYAPAQRPPAQYFNWYWKLVTDWTKYLSDGALAGALALTSDISPTDTGTLTDYNPTGWGSGSTGAQVIRWNGASPASLTSLAGGADGRLAVIENVNASNGLTIKNDDGATGTAANRIYTPEEQDLGLVKQTAALLIYDATSSRWRVVGTSGRIRRLRTMQLGYSLGINVDLSTWTYVSDYIKPTASGSWFIPMPLMAGATIKEIRVRVQRSTVQTFLITPTKTTDGSSADIATGQTTSTASVVWVTHTFSGLSDTVASGKEYKVIIAASGSDANLRIGHVEVDYLEP